MAVRTSLRVVSLTALVLLAFAPALSIANEIREQSSADNLQKRADPFTIYNRKRNAHACVMSIVFCVLYPLGAIGIYLPINRIPGLRNSYLVNKVMAIHAPIQLLAFTLMVAGMALGISIAKFLGYFSGPVQKHMVIGLIVTSSIILFMPILGMLQHAHYKKTGTKSIFGFMHRWIGRCMIILGMINTGLGFQLASQNVIVPQSSYVREYVFMGVLLTGWITCIILDNFKSKSPQDTHIKKGGNDIPLENGNGHSA